MGKSWKEKYHNGKSSLVKVIDKRFADIEAGEKMLIATPEVIDRYIRSIPAGHHTSLKIMRSDLAADQHADKTCPVTTGIFLRIVTEKAYEEWESGTPLQNITPFWRVIDRNAPIVKKLSFDYAFIAEQRNKEGLPA
ncbi:MAG: hypothetical protein AAFO69_02500 [Bacteroidota bacterium]